ncbi:MAG: leucine-rich repeat protein [Clostridia bacterium]|nr:leucine-rich repeat protein [Clostridia bacterium]
MKKIIVLLLALVLVFSLSACGTATKKNEISSIVLSSTEISVSVGETAPLLAEITPAESKDELTWKSSDENVAKYYDGEILGKGKGTCKIIATAPNGVSAECTVTVKGKVVNTGSCGENVSWTYYDDYTLVFSGNGDMQEYCDGIGDFGYEKLPWFSYLSQAQEIQIENGITSICSGAFYKTLLCEKIYVPDSVSIIGNGAFACSNFKSIILSKNIKQFGSRVFRDSNYTIYYPNEQSALISIDKTTYFKNSPIYNDILSHINETNPENDNYYSWNFNHFGKLLFYSETPQENSWHYVNGVPTPW